jgi:peptide/nickel transport system permease protein
VLALAAAAGVAWLVTAGPGRRDVLRSCLATAAVGGAAQVGVTPWLAGPAGASWSNLLLVGVIGLAAAVGIGSALGGLDRGRAVRASVLTAVLVELLMVTDLLLRAVPGYAARVNGRIVATIGAATPDLDGTFWEHRLDTLAHLLLPTVSIVLVSFAAYSRYTRAALLDVLDADYVRTARAKGLPERAVVLRHAVRNALIPVTTLAAVDFGALLAGAVVTEHVFGWQGMGSLFVTGLQQTDPNPVMAFYVVTAGSVVVFNLLADVAYAWLDPRVRLS